MAGNQFQSPLHRGTLFNCCARIARNPSNLYFSPLFIGELSSTNMMISRGSMPGKISVPSSSGNSLQLLRKDSKEPIQLIFQSPLHRGTLFNQKRSSPWKGCVRHFSPLFIGELSSTQSEKFLAGEERTFQSPLHRGTLFNVFFQALTWAHKCDFSPLFIGELSSTTVSLGASIWVVEFQSPLHRGTLFNRSTHVRSIRSRHISVPSSSGNSLQPP